MLLATFITPANVYTILGSLALAVVLLLVDMATKAVTSFRESRKKTKQNSFVYQAEKQVLLDQAAERICLEAKADHVSLYRLHNGEYFEGNDSIKKMSMVCEATKDHWDPRWKDKSQNLPMSNFPHVVLALDGPSKEEFYLVTPENVLDFEFDRLLSERGLTTCVALMVRGKKDRPLAILFLSWRGPRLALTDLDTPRLASNARDLSFTISD